MKKSFTVIMFSLMLAAIAFAADNLKLNQRLD